MWPSGAMKAPYDEPAPMCRPNEAMLASMPDIASSQIPPIESTRDSGFDSRL